MHLIYNNAFESFCLCSKNKWTNIEISYFVGFDFTLAVYSSQLKTWEEKEGCFWFTDSLFLNLKTKPVWFSFPFLLAVVAERFCQAVLSSLPYCQFKFSSSTNIDFSWITQVNLICMRPGLLPKISDFFPLTSSAGKTSRGWSFILKHKAEDITPMILLCFIQCLEVKICKVELRSDNTTKKPQEI